MNKTEIKVIAILRNSEDRTARFETRREYNALMELERCKIVEIIRSGAGQVFKIGRKPKDVFYVIARMK